MTLETGADIWDPYAFGGSPKQVRRTQRRFVRWFAARGPVLDIGCGRGIFLQLLQESGIESVGIDQYEPAIAACRALGFTAHVTEAVDFLEGRVAQFGGIFCSHVIEHLPFEQATRLMALSAAALIPGGTLIVVTPNPSDLGVLGETFWLDPTHVRLYPVRLLASLMEAAGLQVVEVGTFHGGLPKREWMHAVFYRLRLGKYHGHPNAYAIGRKV